MNREYMDVKFLETMIKVWLIGDYEHKIQFNKYKESYEDFLYTLEVKVGDYLNKRVYNPNTFEPITFIPHYKKYLKFYKEHNNEFKFRNTR